MLFQIISIAHEQVQHLLKLCIGNPSENKLDNILSSYTKPDSLILGCIIKDSLVGMVGIKISYPVAIIRHIAVLDEYRKLGIASALINHLIDNLKLSKIKAETDIEAVGFYKKCGFACTEFQGVYNKRFKCVKTIL
jgi:GNAT superfamily N-acetyltransferase